MFSKLHTTLHKLHTILHNFTAYHKTPQNSTQVYTTIQHFCQLVLNFTKLCKQKTLHNLTNTFTTLYKTLHNSTQFYNTLTTFYNNKETYTSLPKNKTTTLYTTLHKLNATQQNSAKLNKHKFTHILHTQKLHKTLQSTQLYTFYTF